jgi:hypothetical protein
MRSRSCIGTIGILIIISVLIAFTTSGVNAVKKGDLSAIILTVLGLAIGGALVWAANRYNL